MPEVDTKNSFKVSVTGEHREGICEKCKILLVKEFYVYYEAGYPPASICNVWIDGNRKRVRMVCPICGALGRLIVKTYSVQPPDPPQCLALRCLYHFFMDTLFCALLSNYHSRRVAYAERNRHKEILERYRTGEPSPKTIWQAIHANIKLKCPLCRCYNIDPFLGGKRNVSKSDLD